MLVFQTGILLDALSAIAYEVPEATDGTLYTGVGLVGGSTALVAMLRGLVTLPDG